MVFIFVHCIKNISMGLLCLLSLILIVLLTFYLLSFGFVICKYNIRISGMSLSHFDLAKCVDLGQFL